MQELRQSTSITEKFGPFLDETNGKDPETTLTITQADIRLTKNGGDFGQSNDAGGGSHDEAAWYDVTLDATDTNTLGRLVVQIHESGALPVWREFMVVTANYWDSKYSTDKLQVNLTQIDGNATNGYNATLKLLQLDIQNNAGTAIIAKATGGNGHGMELAGNGTGEGLNALGGLTGYGIEAKGGATSGAGIYASAQNNNDAGMELVKHGTGKDLDAGELLTAAQVNVQCGAALTAARTGYANVFWNALLPPFTVENSAGWLVWRSFQVLTNRLEIDVPNSKQHLYDTDGETKIMTWPLFDKDGNPITLAVGAIAERGIRSL